MQIGIRGVGVNLIDVWCFQARKALLKSRSSVVGAGLLGVTYCTLNSLCVCVCLWLCVSVCATDKWLKEVRIQANPANAL